MITSSANNRIKNVIQLKKKAKERERQDLFLVEGIRMFLEADPERIREAYLSESFSKQYRHDRDVQALLEKIPAEVVSDAVFEAMSDTRTPQGVICLMTQYHYREEDLFPEGKVPMIMVLETIQDPGNLGTVFRTAEGAGVTGIVMSDDTADLYNPKVIRSTMGSIYRMPFVCTSRLADQITRLQWRGVKCHAAHLKGSVSYDEPDYRGPCAFLIGNEARGLSEETAALADCRIHIPMLGKVESLNAAAASAILMYEAARQRRVGIGR